MMGALVENNWYDSAKERAAARFATLPWPGVPEEEWRRSDLTPLRLDGFVGAAGASAVSFAADLPAGAVASGLRLLPSSLSRQAPGLGEVAGARRALLRALESGDRFAAWNVAEGEAWTLEIPQGLTLESPVSITCLTKGAVAHPRLAILVGKGARVDVVYRVIVQDEGALVPRFANLALDVEVGDGASLRLFEERSGGDEAAWFAHGDARLARDARFSHLLAADSGRFVVSRFECSLEGEGSEADLDGAFAVRRNGYFDFRTVQRHLAPRATSRALYKGVLEAGGRSVCQGLIEVAGGARGTDAFLANRNLLLGDGARADSLPTLRISNNDVRCSHGSATARLPESELFYLESRGFDRASARELLVRGFFAELLDKAPASFGEGFAAGLVAGLGAAPALGGRAA